jgi:hypothetical protein
MKKFKVKYLILYKMPFSSIQQALFWIQEQGIEKLREKEGILCECKWVALWVEDTFWNDMVMEYVDTISKDDHQDIIREVGLTKTITFMIKDCDGAEFFYQNSQIVDYEGLLCQYALEMKLRGQLDEIYEVYIKKIGVKHEARFCDDKSCGVDSDSEND